MKNKRVENKRSSFTPNLLRWHGVAPPTGLLALLPSLFLQQLLGGFDCGKRNGFSGCEARRFERRSRRVLSAGRDAEHA